MYGPAGVPSSSAAGWHAQGGSYALQQYVPAYTGQQLFVQVAGGGPAPMGAPLRTGGGTVGFTGAFLPLSVMLPANGAGREVYPGPQLTGGWGQRHISVVPAAGFPGQGAPPLIPQPWQQQPPLPQRQW
jgi:hypothetical protein